MKTRTYCRAGRTQISLVILCFYLHLEPKALCEKLPSAERSRKPTDDRVQGAQVQDMPMQDQLWTARQLKQAWVNFLENQLPHHQPEFKRSDTKAAPSAQKLWEDKDFPTNDHGIFRNPLGDMNETEFLFLRPYFKDYYNLDVEKDPILWLRPREICSRMGWPSPKFVVNGYSIFDLNQGRIGNCWFVGGVSHLPNRPNFLRRVVPANQGFGANYNGKFRFNFWRDGQWAEVTVDDRLPCETKDGQVVGLLGVSNPREPNEFWGPLLEKAYAKACGRSYQCLHAYWAIQALVAITGGGARRFGLRSFEQLHHFYRLGFLIVTHRDGMRNDTEDLGLVSNHAYTFSESREVMDKAGRLHQLVRLRNPYGCKPNNGMDVEWKGAWSDGSPHWGLLDDEVRAEMLKVDPRDGEFWMSFDDLTQHFEDCDVCASSANVPVVVGDIIVGVILVSCILGL